MRIYLPTPFCQYSLRTTPHYNAMMHLIEMFFDSGEDLTFFLCWKKVWLLIYAFSFGQKTGFLKHILRTFVKAVQHFDLIWYSAVIPILIEPYERMVFDISLLCEVVSLHFNEVIINENKLWILHWTKKNSRVLFWKSTRKILWVT